MQYRDSIRPNQTVSQGHYCQNCWEFARKVSDVTRLVVTVRATLGRGSLSQVPNDKAEPLLQSVSSEPQILEFGHLFLRHYTA